MSELHRMKTCSSCKYGVEAYRKNKTGCFRCLRDDVVLVEVMLFMMIASGIITLTVALQFLR